MFWQFRRELLGELLKQNMEVYLATPFNGHEDDFIAMGCHIIRTDLERRGLNPVSEERLFRLYIRTIKEVKPDLVITYSIKPNIYAGFAASLLHVPYCVNVQGLGTAFEKRGMAAGASVLYRLACRKAGCVFFENKRNAQYFVRHRIVPKEKIKVLHGAGVNLEHFAYHKPAPFASDQKTKRPFHFLYLGRIMKEKGIDELFYAVQKLSEEGYDSSAQGPSRSYSFVLDLVGFFEDEYKEEVDELEKKGLVRFYGFQEDPRPYYEKADCVVLPSYHEGMSNVLLEAAASGRMLVTSAIPGCREAVDQKKTGFLCRPKDPESLYRVMRHVLRLSPGEVEDMGLAGRRKMEQEFDRRNIVEETVGVLCSQSQTTGG